MDKERTQFDYLLNAFEQASQALHPADHGYGDKRKALFAYVRNLEAVVGKLRDLRDTQGQHGTWNVDHYMQGLYNGLELALSAAEGRDPVFRDAPADGWLGWGRALPSASSVSGENAPGDGGMNG